MILKRIVSLLCLVIMMFGLVPSISSADTQSCVTNGANCFDGIVSNLGGNAQITSVYTDITTPNTYPANYSPSRTSAWDMIAKNTGGVYVQVGWIESNNTTGHFGISSISVPNGVSYFFEINYGVKDSDYQVYSPGGPALGTTHGYRVFQSGTNWVGTVDGTTIDTEAQTYNGLPFTYGDNVQYSEELAGSGTAQNSAFAGLASNHARFSNLRAFSNGTTYYSPDYTTSGSYFVQDQNAGMDNFSYHIGQQNNSYLEFWDLRY